MRKSLLDRLRREGIVDTNCYRYILSFPPFLCSSCEVRRISLSKLDTVAALDPGSWELVEVL